MYRHLQYRYRGPGVGALFPYQDRSLMGQSVYPPPQTHTLVQ